MQWEASIKALKKDPYFKELIQKHGTPRLEDDREPFAALVRAIVHQQVSGKAAETIFGRFVALFPKNKFPTPAQVLKMPTEKMRAVGLSGQKTSYIKDLAEKFANGTIKHTDLHTMESGELIEHLVQVKGVGVWTAHMFLIFTLHRADVLPTGDLGVRKGFQVVYGLRSLPDHKKMEALAKGWRQHASAASWYLWRVADEVNAAGRPKIVASAKPPKARKPVKKKSL